MLFSLIYPFQKIFYWAWKVLHCPEKKSTIQLRASRKVLEFHPYLIESPRRSQVDRDKRVALARLLARNPSIHLLDEPLSNLDANLRIQMREELVKLHQKHRKTTLFVTHDQVEAMTLGERICLLNNGKIEQIGSPREIYDAPANLFVAGFFGIPSINLIPGKVEAQPGSNTCDFICKNSSVRFELPSFIQTERKDLILGIRPEKFRWIRNAKPTVLRLFARNTMVTHRYTFFNPRTFP